MPFAMKKYRFLLVLVIVFLGTAALLTRAQETALQPPAACDHQQIVTDLQTKTTALNPDADTFLTDLQDIQAYIAGEHFKCSGLSLSGEPVSGKQSVVLGPYAIPDGLYRLTMTSSEQIRITADKLAGKCGTISFSAKTGEATNGTEDTVKFSENCQFVLTIDAAGPWALVFEPLGPAS